MKKLTKKEIELIEIEKREKARVRRAMISDLKNYWEDVEAVIRVAKINGETEKLKYNDRLNEEETQKLLNRYESIKDLSDNQKQIIRTLIHNERDRRDNTTKEYLSEILSTYCWSNTSTIAVPSDLRLETPLSSLAVIQFATSITDVLFTDLSMP